MKKYLLSSKKYGNMVSLEYDEDGRLKALRFETNLDDEQINFILAYAVRLEYFVGSVIPHMKVKLPHIKLEQMEEDLSFERFWEEYGFKKGKKDRVRRKWEAMEEADRYKALAYVKKYKFFLAERPHIQQKYPETYLNTAEWNN